MAPLATHQRAAWRGPRSQRTKTTQYSILQWWSRRSIRAAGNDLIANSPHSEALAAGENGRGRLVAPCNELEEEHGAGAADQQIADLLDDEHGRRWVQISRRCSSLPAVWPSSRLVTRSECLSD